jgi:twitching motility protein PilT
MQPTPSPTPTGAGAGAGPGPSSPQNQLESLLKDLVGKGGSDLHLLHGYAPIYRVSAEVTAFSQTPLNTEDIWKLVEPYVDTQSKETFERDCRVNVSFTVNGIGRFRMNVAKAQGTISASIRAIPNKIYPLSALGLPPIVGQLTQKKKGIILITGATGSGKSTTMAAMLDHINKVGRPGKVVTIEDPIETLFAPQKCFFLQREVGVDTPSFELGIQDALRQDPDIICIGELRNSDSIKAALTAAETGHLVLSTLHTPDSAKTAQRIISSFPGNEQETIRDQVATTLEAVISQHLLPRADGKGLVLAIEVLIATPAVRQLIKKGDLGQLYDILQTGTSQGMISMDASIKQLFQRKMIKREVALGLIRNASLLG